MVGYTVCTNKKTVPYKHTNTAVYTAAKAASLSLRLLRIGSMEGVVLG